MKRKKAPKTTVKTHTYTIEIEKGEDGFFVVSIPVLPGCLTQGRTYEEAIHNAEECIAGFIEALIKAGQPVPVESMPAKRVAVSVRVNALAATVA